MAFSLSEVLQGQPGCDAAVSSPETQQGLSPCSGSTGADPWSPRGVAGGRICWGSAWVLMIGTQVSVVCALSVVMLHPAMLRAWNLELARGLGPGARCSGDLVFQFPSQGE